MTQLSQERVEVAPHEVHRLSIEVAAPFEEFRDRYEQAVPEFDSRRFDRLIQGDAGWDDVLQATSEAAPHDFLIYWSRDFSSLMRMAGNRQRGAEYLMGNHTIAQRMYRHNPAIILYAPLRTAIYEDAAGGTWFTVDQPSTRFSSFDNSDIADVGVELDLKLAALLRQLGTPVPAVLTSGRNS